MEQITVNIVNRHNVLRWPVVTKLFKICENFSRAKALLFHCCADTYNYNIDDYICNV